MKKFFSVFALAALVGLASCSSDEPRGDEPSFNGETTYLNVALRDGGSRSRAEGEEATKPADYTNGVDNEGKISDAKFFFFDENGMYVGQATIWNGGNPQTDGNNVELKGNSVVVLDNLKGNTYPRYMVTLLNCGNRYDDAAMNANFSKITNFAKDITTWGTDVEGGFLMATSSYFNNSTTEAAGYKHDTYPYATVLEQSNFQRTAALAATANPVQVYVERLAVRVRTTYAANYSIDVTINGNENSDLDGENSGNVAGTPLKVVIDGWGLNQTAPQSYLCKEIANETFPQAGAAAGTNWAWNNASDFRSFWGHSINYGTDVTNALTRYTYDQLNSTTKGTGTAQYSVAYCNENTNTRAALKLADADRPNLQMLTSVIVKAHIEDAAGNKVNLIEHRGSYFTFDQFKNYVLSILNNAGKLNYYTKDGNNFTQVDASFFTIAAVDVNNPNERVYVAPVAANFNAPVAIYAYNEAATTEDEKYTVVTDPFTTLDADLKAATAAYPTTAFKEGMMYYNVPIAHLNAPVRYTAAEALAGNGVAAGDLKAWETGSFGVVRNHTYEVKINSVAHLGNGIFDPTKGVIKPDTDERHDWYLGATINVLAWKIVNNEVNL